MANTTNITAKDWADLTDRERATAILQSTFNNDMLPAYMRMTEADEEVRHSMSTDLFEQEIYGDDGNNFEDALNEIMAELTIDVSKALIAPAMDGLETAHKEAARRGADNPHAVAADVLAGMVNRVVYNFAGEFLPKLAAIMMSYAQRGGLESLSYTNHRLESTLRSAAAHLTKQSQDFDATHRTRIKEALSQIAHASMVQEDGFARGTGGRTKLDPLELTERAMADENALAELAEEIGIATTEVDVDLTV